MKATPSLRALAERGEVDAFDRAAAALDHSVLDGLLSTTAAEERARLAAFLPPASLGARLPVPQLARAGAPGFWIATEWVLRVLPGPIRSAPSSTHEQWDALVEINKSRPEAAWLVIELLGALQAEQEALGRRVVLGLERRFGERIAPIALARLRRGGAPLDAMLQSVASAPLGARVR